MSRSLSAPPILAYGTARPKRWPLVVVTAVVVLLLAGLLGWRNLDAIRQWNIDRQNRSEIRDSIESNLSKADLDISSARWADAQIDIDRAILVANANPVIFSAKEIARFRATNAAAQQRLDAMHEQFLQSHPSENTRAPRGCTFNVNDLVERARHSFLKAEYGDAREVAEQVLVLDPSNQHALELLRQANEHLPSSRPAR